MVRDVRLKRAAFDQPHEFPIGHVSQRHGRAACQGMPARHDQCQRVMAERARVQAMQVRRIRQHADVAHACTQRVSNLMARAFFQIHRHAGVVLQKLAQHRRQVFTKRGGVAHHANVAFQAESVVIQFTAHAVHLPQHQPGVMRQRAPCRRRRHAAMLAQQQRHAQRVFHAAYAFAGRRQRHVGTLGARRDGARFLHVQEEPEIGQVESHSGSVARQPQAQP